MTGRIEQVRPTLLDALGSAVCPCVSESRYADTIGQTRSPRSHRRGVLVRRHTIAISLQLPQLLDEESLNLVEPRIEFCALQKSADARTKGLLGLADGHVVI